MIGIFDNFTCCSCKNSLFLLWNWRETIVSCIVRKDFVHMDKIHCSFQRIISKLRIFCYMIGSFYLIASPTKTKFKSEFCIRKMTGFWMKKRRYRFYLMNLMWTTLSISNRNSYCLEIQSCLIGWKWMVHSLDDHDMIISFFFTKVKFFDINLILWETNHVVLFSYIMNNFELVSLILNIFIQLNHIGGNISLKREDLASLEWELIKLDTVTLQDLSVRITADALESLQKIDTTVQQLTRKWVQEIEALERKEEISGIHSTLQF